MDKLEYISGELVINSIKRISVWKIICLKILLLKAI